ncbi:MAG: hypothetical protein VYA97_00470 [Pseudomonadota bacterium]|nr:hypothetical protein [Pseudomonadota bacterium]
MKRRFEYFCRSETGAVTVDWVVLTAGVIILMGIAYGAVESGTLGLSTNIGAYMASQ